jgi:hypothetical protein
MAKKMTLDELGDMLTHVVKHMATKEDLERFATKEDIAEIKRDMATKDQIIALQTQVNSIEHQLRTTKSDRRLGDLEEEVFGSARA